jgi:cellulose synthase/poly-beta-1,6-N-acetylglucosamine synthase-like glycosyltransferase
MDASASNNVITTDAACPAADNNSQSVVIIIPTLNEEASIGEVVRTLPFDLVGRVIVADGGSTDGTAERARATGADMVDAGRGYGRAA